MNNKHNTTSFTNPYNFVSLGEKCDKKESRQSGRLSGVLTCELTTKTPLFIPNTTNNHAFPQWDKRIVHKYNKNSSNKKKVKDDAPKSYDFYSYETLNGDRENMESSRPIIPGSSIRGVIRSAYETVTNSCLSTCGSDEFIHKRGTMAQNPGLIIKSGEKWELYEAEKVMINIKVNGKPRKQNPNFGTYYDRDKLPAWGEVYVKRTRGHYGNYVKHFCVVDISNKQINDDYSKGYYLRGEDFSRKHHDAVMIKIENRTPIFVGKEDQQRFKRVIDIYSPAYKGINKADNIPVYYDFIPYYKGTSLRGEEKGFCYITPACYSQESYNRRVKDILKHQGDYTPCEDSKELCEACHLFGMVCDNDALASRVSFRDAVPDDNVENWSDWYDSIRTLAILGEPHVSATEFYMEDPGKKYDMFNYDYATVSDNGRNSRKVALTDAQVKLRGRKYYWHSKKQEDAKDNDNPEQLWTVRPVKADKRFKFEIAFEQLTEDELSKLIWTLQIGGRETHAHKLGHGKPIGYGSVQICVDMKNSHLWTLDDMLRIKSKPIDVPAWSPSGKSIDEYLKITDFKERPNNVSYPSGDIDNRKTTYNWFVLNKEMSTHNPMNPRITKVLPMLDDISTSLPVYKKSGRGKDANYKPERVQDIKGGIRK